MKKTITALFVCLSVASCVSLHEDFMSPSDNIAEEISRRIMNFTVMSSVDVLDLCLQKDKHLFDGAPEQGWTGSSVWTFSYIGTVDTGNKSLMTEGAVWKTADFVYEKTDKPLQWTVTPNVPYYDYEMTISIAQQEADTTSWVVSGGGRTLEEGIYHTVFNIAENISFRSYHIHDNNAVEYFDPMRKGKLYVGVMKGDALYEDYTLKINGGDDE